MEGTGKNIDLLNSNGKEGKKEDSCPDCDIATGNYGKPLFLYPRTN